MAVLIALCCCADCLVQSKPACVIRAQEAQGGPTAAAASHAQNCGALKLDCME